MLQWTGSSIFSFVHISKCLPRVDSKGKYTLEVKGLILPVKNKEGILPAATSPYSL